jgi:FLVCR family feline leukemia virus subgroup C receptor-related protein
VLLALMAVTLACEVEWLAHAAVARPAAAYYAGQFNPSSLFNIDFLSMSYMLVFLVACLPASWVLDRWGLGAGVGIGAVLTIIGSVVKGALAPYFAAQVAGQLVLALAQPFLTNAATTLARDWFPVKERATASGLASLAQYLGFVVALVAAPAFVQVDPALPNYGAGMDRALLAFAALSAAAGLLALAFVRRGPNRELSDEASAFFGSLKRLMKSRDFRWTFVLFLLGLGIMNTVTAMTDSIAAAMGVVDSNGLLGVGLILGGIVGAVVLPILSDWLGRRKAFLVLCMGLTVPALWALVLAPGGWYALGIAAMALLGFALMSAGPIGFQYAAETTAPVPESASQGLLLLAGQVSGLVFTAGMSAGGARAVRPWLLGFALAALAMTLMSTKLRESPAVSPRKRT